MRGYRSDSQSRCSRCQSAVAADELFMTVETELLCPRCRVGWAEEERKHALRSGSAFNRDVPGFRLFCPSCNAASMRVRQGDFSLIGTCTRCGRVARRHRGGWFLAFALGFMVTPFLDVAIGWPVLSLLLGAWVAYSIGRDVLGRSRYRVATVDEIEAAERAERGADRTRARAAAESSNRVRVAEAKADARAAELEADAEQAELEADAEQAELERDGAGAAARRER